MNKLTKSKTENSSVRANNQTPVLHFCRANCSVCSSGQLEYITEKRNSGMYLIDLSEHLKEKFDLNLSKDVLWRHFRNYKKALALRSSEIILREFNHKAETVAKHQKSTLYLIKKSFDHICQHLESGTLTLGVDDFTKLVNLYYGILRDPDASGDEDIIAIFQKAATRYGFPLEQGILIKNTSNKKVTSKSSE